MAARKKLDAKTVMLQALTCPSCGAQKAAHKYDLKEKIHTDSDGEKWTWWLNRIECKVCGWRYVAQSPTKNGPYTYLRDAEYQIHLKPGFVHKAPAMSEQQIRSTINKFFGSTENAAQIINQLKDDDDDSAYIKFDNLNI